MDPNEALTIVEVLEATWVGKEWTDNQRDLWVRDLIPMNRWLAEDAVEDLRRSEDYRPTFNKFLMAYQAVGRRQAAARAESTGLPTVPIDPRDGIAQVRRMRKLMSVTGYATTKAGLRGHDHHQGAEGCPVCSRHDQAAHHHDRNRGDHTLTLKPTCVRCAELAGWISGEVPLCDEHAAQAAPYHVVNENPREKYL